MYVHKVGMPNVGPEILALQGETRGSKVLLVVEHHTEVGFMGRWFPGVSYPLQCPQMTLGNVPLSQVFT